jgi:hypothetical protein
LLRLRRERKRQAGDGQGESHEVLLLANDYSREVRR